MKIGLKDIRNLAIIGAAGAAGVVATLVVFGATERSPVHHEVITVDHAPIVHFRSSVRVVRPEREQAEEAAGVRAGRVHFRTSETIEPIVYIDGVRVNGPGLHPLPESVTGLDDLTPEDIEKIDVLKGPKAVELYGKEGENGVIEVTTKKGKKKGSKEGAEKGR